MSRAIVAFVVLLDLGGLLSGQAPAAGTSKTFSITGRVQNPGQYELREGMFIADGISRAGYLLEGAHIEGVKVIRGRMRISFNYAWYLVGKRAEDNIPLQNGDVIVVP